MLRSKLKALLWLVVALFLGMSLVGYHAVDASWNTASDITQNYLGPMGAWTADFLLQIFGFMAFVVPLICLMQAFFIGFRVRWGQWRFLCAVIALIWADWLLGTATLNTAQHWFKAGTGGFLGYYLNQWWAIPQGYGRTLWWLMAIALFIFSFKIPCVKILVLFGKALWWVMKKLGVKAPQAVIHLFHKIHARCQKVKIKAPLPKTKKKTPKLTSVPVQAKKGNYELPSSKLLLPIPQNLGPGISNEQVQMTAQRLETVLHEFGVPGKVVKSSPGPVVTLFSFEPASGVKVSRIISLADSVTMNMGVQMVRMAVIPGTNTIGVEVPNPKRLPVSIREMIEQQSFWDCTGRLPIILGKNIGGNPVYADLADMPHLLVAGTTGSGKSVGVNTMILSLLYRFTPEQCRFILVDPKKVEFALYEGIPHLLTPVITESAKALMALKWAVHEMEYRYRAMEYLKVKHITTYNEKVKEAKEKGEVLKRRVQTGFDPATGEPIMEEQPLDLTPWPYIIFIVDELADLMGQCGKEANPLIQRIAQMARAVGIHLILATQRPSVDVVTGTIKSNFPTRISFMVRNKIDSRTILDEQGAEQLLGKGDMLYTPSGKKAIRVHGPYVDEKDVIAVVKHWANQGEPKYVDAVVAESAQMAGMDSGSAAGGSSLYDQAVAIVLRDKKPTTSYIQRRLSIGYNKAADLIDQMEANGIISAPNVAGKREILKGE